VGNFDEIATIEYQTFIAVAMNPRLGLWVTFSKLAHYQVFLVARQPIRDNIAESSKGCTFCAEAGAPRT